MSTNASKLSLLAPNVNTSGTVEATTLDGLDSSQFLRSDIAVTKTGNLTVNGNVGIGDSSPDYKLTINSASADSVFGIRYNDTARIEMAVDGNWNYYKALSGQSVKFTTTGYTGTASLSVLNNGYVGIGHDNPSSRLSVYDMGGADGTASRTAFFGNLTTGATSSSLYIGSYSGIDWQIGKNVIGSSARWNFDIADHQNNIALSITPSREVLIGTGTADQGIPGLTIGRAVAGDNNDYGVSIIRHGTGSSPGTFTVNRGAINVSDTAGEGPASYIQNGSLINAGYGRMLTSDPNTHLGALIDISYDGGLSPLRLDLKGNMWLGHNRATAETSASTTHALFAAGPIWSRTGLVNVKNSIMPGAGSTLTYGADDCLPGLAQSFGTFLTTGASAQTGNSTPGADGHIWSATWTNTTVYGCQLYIDTDPTNYIAVRTRNSTGTWQSWRVL